MEDAQQKILNLAHMAPPEPHLDRRDLLGGIVFTGLGFFDN